MGVNRERPKPSALCACDPVQRVHDAGCPFRPTPRQALADAEVVCGVLAVEADPWRGTGPARADDLIPAAEWQAAADEFVRQHPGLFTPGAPSEPADDSVDAQAVPSPPRGDGKAEVADECTCDACVYREAYDMGRASLQPLLAAAEAYAKANQAGRWGDYESALDALCEAALAATEVK